MNTVEKVLWKTRLLSLLLPGILLGYEFTAQAAGPEPVGWYAGDMHVHRSCGGSPVTVSSIYNTMIAQDVAVVSLLADMGNGEVQNPVTDLPRVTGQNDPVSTAGRIVHWDAEWHWDPTYSQYPHHALGGHILALGLTNAYQIWQEYTYPIFDWAHRQRGIAGFAHMQYLDDGFPQSLNCCIPIEYPVEVALGACDFISEDVNGSDTAIHAYYRLLNCGFRPGLAAGSDYPCGSVIGPLLTYSRVAGGSLTYSNWIGGIVKGRTAVSRNGRSEFLDLKVNGSVMPGDEIQLPGGESVPVDIQWTANRTLAGTIELVCNGEVVASKVVSGVSGSLSTTVDFTRSGWLCARRMSDRGHEFHTAAVFVTVDRKPVRASVTDAQFYVQWMDNLLQNTSPGGIWSSYFVTNRAKAQARYSAAKSIYQQIATEAAALPSLSVTTISLSNANLNVAYTGTLTAAGGTLPYTWSLAGGSLPSGLTLTGGGIISGKPTASGTFNFVVRVSDTSNPIQTATKSLSITIGQSSVSITTISLPNGVVNGVYATTLTAVGGTLPYTWSIAGGSLPPGLTLTSGGTIGGTPTTMGTFSFTAQVKDAGNPAQTVSNVLGITIASSLTVVTIWSNTTMPNLVDNGPDSAVELGVKFQSDVEGTIAGIRFYKTAANTGTHIGNLWTSNGTLLATVIFNETVSGWQQALFTTPVTIASNTVYVASYHANNGHFSEDDTYFQGKGVDNPPLHALADGVAGGNGVYAYGASSAFPNQTWNAANYWVDVVFQPRPTLTSIILIPSNSSILTGVSRQFTATAIYTDGSAQNITSHATWTSSNPGVATINAGGLATGVSTGATIISATLSGVVGSMTLTVNTPVVITTTSLPSGIMNVAYTGMLTAGGGTFPYTWSIASGSLPPGLTLTGDGIISGTPTATGTFNFAAQVSDTGNPIQTTTKSLNITIVQPISISTISLLNGVIDVAYTGTLTAGGGTFPYTWSIASGSLPPGLTLTGDGIISGTSTATGTFNFAAQVSDTGNPIQTTTKSLSITIVQPISISTISLLNGVIDVAYTGTLTAGGGTFPYTWSIASGSLPPGLTLTGDGIISGTSTATGTFNFAAQVSDTGNPIQTTTKSLSITIVQPISISTISLLNGVIDVAYTGTLTAGGGTFPYTWSIASGSLPPGLTLTGDGIISGTSTATGTFNFAAQVSDTGNPIQTTTKSLSITIVQPISISTISLLNGVIDVAYTGTLTAGGGTFPYTWSIASGSLPPGLTLTSGGTIGGTPTATGTFNFAAQVSDMGNPIQTTTKSLNITIVQPISISTISLLNGVIDVAYTGTLTAGGGTFPYTWSIASGSLPPGLTLTGDGIISGTPNTRGTVSFTAQVMDAGNPIQTATKSLSINIMYMPPKVTIWPDTTVPEVVDSVPDSSVELGVKFYSDVDGTIAGIRFYKAVANTGIHIGNLWSSDGTHLATATFSNETASGWQQVLFATPAAIASNTVYVASYHVNNGHYSADLNYFQEKGVNNPPLHALTNGVSGGNGVYVYSASNAFPTQSWYSANYWVDVVFQAEPLPPPPALTSITVASTNSNILTGATQQFTATGIYSEGRTQDITSQATWTSSNTGVATINEGGLATGVSAGITTISATLSGVVSSTTLTVQPPPPVIVTTSLPAGVMNMAYTGTLIAAGGTLPYSWSIASGSLPPGLTLTSAGIISGTPTTTGTVSFTAQVRDAGNPSQTVTSPLSITTTKAAFSPILILTNAANPFSQYYAEILLTEGLNGFELKDISSVSSVTLAPYDIVILGEVALTPSQVTSLSNWVNAGGNLIAMRPDKKLAELLGLVDTGATIFEGYLLVNTSTSPGAGIVGETIQFHGVADRYTLGNASKLATLYSNPQTATINPAVTLRSVGSNGGQAAAFTYDLARSIVYTRQGNPAWAGQDRDGTPPIQSYELFYGAADDDPQPDWVNLNKVAIPQADEQQRLLANLIITMDSDRNLLPRFWYFPHGYEAVVVMTGDDHGGGGTAGRFDQYMALSPVGGSVDDWETIRSTSYVFLGSPLTDIQAAAYNTAGFEIGLHLSTSCANYTRKSLEEMFLEQLRDWRAMYPSLPPQTTHRAHCIAWSDYTTMPEVEVLYGIRLDLNYYYYPSNWVADRPGFFTGSGMPMRFATATGDVIDVYQAATEMTDESSQSYPYMVDYLLDRALGPEGYYGAFVVNAHTDTASPPESNAIIASAINREVPVISARQLLTWLDARNASSLKLINWNNNRQTFSVNADKKARGLLAMAPVPDGYNVREVECNGGSISYYLRGVKGFQYAMFPVTNGDYEISYATDNTPPSITEILPTHGQSKVGLNTKVSVTFSEAMNASTINTNTITLRDSSNHPVAATVLYNASSFTAVLTPINPLAPLANYTAIVMGGVTDVAGNPRTNDCIWSFTTDNIFSIWPDTTAPVGVSASDTNAVEVGMKFISDVAGTITGIRFYKATDNTGTHIGNLWTGNGALLATVTFTKETAWGWQQALFDTPVTITSNTAYVASYHANGGHYSADLDYFQEKGVNNPPLHALTNSVSDGNGVYVYESSSAFPNRSYRAANYWVDVVFKKSVP